MISLCSRSRLEALAKDKSGQSLVEFALVLIIMLLLVVGIIEFGRAFNVYQVLTNASREGARLAALPDGFTTSDAVLGQVNGYLVSAGIDPNNVAVAIGGAGVDGGTGSQVSITLSYPYQFFYVGPIIRLLNPAATAGADITLQTQSVMRNE